MSPRAGLLVILLAAIPAARADEAPYPPGESTRTLEGLETVLILPRDLTAEKPASLLLILHGAGGTAVGMARSFAAWADDGYVVAAPPTWSASPTGGGCSRRSRSTTT